MPLQAISCTSCGSSNVQEVKPGTFFCDNCETVFKYVDPTKLTVSHNPAFCFCGNPIEFQCQICGKGICGECDVIEWQKRVIQRDFYGPPRNPAEFPNASVPVVGFGYIGSDPRRTGQSSIINGIIANAKLNLGSRFLTVNEILVSISAKHRNEVRHLCLACLADAIPETAALIADGRICEIPGCPTKAAAKCACCEGNFCEEDLIFWSSEELPTRVKVRALTPDQRRLISDHVETIVAEEWREKWDSSTWKKRLEKRRELAGKITWRATETLCEACLREKKEQAAEEARTILEKEYSDKLIRLDDGMYAVGAPSKLAYWLSSILGYSYSLSTNKEDLARRYADAVSEKLKGRVTVGGNCNRRAGYKIIDERDRVAPGPAPEATASAP